MTAGMNFAKMKSKIDSKERERKRNRDMKLEG